MYKVDNRKLAQKILHWIRRVTRLPVLKPYGFVQSSKNHNADRVVEPRNNQCCSGGYNEAFIFEHWSSYGPLH